MAESNSKKILLAEDDEFLSSLIKNRLEREGFTVQNATTGDQVMDFLRSFKPDLVLLDIILPGKLGFEILEEMKADKELDIPFMVLSNLGQESDIEKAKQFGAIDYFIKAHIMIDDLIKRVTAFLKAGK